MGKNILIGTPLGEGELDPRQEVEVYVSKGASFTMSARELRKGNCVLFDVRKSTATPDEVRRVAEPYDNNHCMVPIVSVGKVKGKNSKAERRDAINPGTDKHSVSVGTLLRDAQVANSYSSYMISGRLVFEGVPISEVSKYRYHVVRFFSSGGEEYNEHAKAVLQSLERKGGQMCLAEALNLIGDLQMKNLRYILDLDSAAEEAIKTCVMNDAPDEMFGVERGTTKRFVELEKRIAYALPKEVVRWFRLRRRIEFPTDSAVAVDFRKLRPLHNLTRQLKAEYGVNMNDISAREVSIGPSSMSSASVIGFKSVSTCDGEPMGELEQYNPVKRFSPEEREGFLRRHGFEYLVGLDVGEICSGKLAQVEDTTQ